VYKIQATHHAALTEKEEISKLLSELGNIKESYQKTKSLLRSNQAKSLWRLRKKLIAAYKEKVRKDREQHKLETLVEAERLYQKTICDAESQCLTTITALAKKIFNDRILQGYSELSSRIATQLKSLRVSREVTITVNPTELKIVYSDLHDQFSKISLEILGDETICNGNARIKTSTGCIELDWRAQLEELVNLIRQNQR